MTNDRLRLQMELKGVTTADLASELEIDPKSIGRWVRLDRLPRKRHRVRAAEMLGATEYYLWPNIPERNGSQRFTRTELSAIYRDRGAVPPALWMELATNAHESIDLLVYAGLFLLDSHPELPEVLIRKAEAGVQVRLLFGDPCADSVKSRGIDEETGANLAARIRLSLGYLAEAADCEGIDLRLHDSVLYNSIFRFDDQMLVNTHAAGSQAARNPVMHLRYLGPDQLFDHYVASFEHVWQKAKPCTDVAVPCDG